MPFRKLRLEPQTLNRHMAAVLKFSGVVRAVLPRYGLHQFLEPCIPFTCSCDVVAIPEGMILSGVVSAV